jgi:hypothetical protein
MPADQWLTQSENDLKWAIVNEIEALGYKAEIFFDPRGGMPGLAAAKAWSAVEADKVMRHCVGTALIGMPRWTFDTAEGEVLLSTEYCQYEGAIAYTLRLPMLVLVQKAVLRRVVFDHSYNGYVGVIPSPADQGWLTSKEFQVPFDFWKSQLAQRRDVFLGYCGASANTALKIKTFLKEELGVSVLDWMTDFPPAGFILERISDAANRCSAGIFLFTRDDFLEDSSSQSKALPRDNVVFEAGYFISAKSKGRVLIVLEKNAKMPADLGGDIYASLKEITDKANPDITSVKDTLHSFINAL